MADFDRALDEIRPAFGMDNSGLENKLVGGIYSYGDSFDKVIAKCVNNIEEIRESKNT